MQALLKGMKKIRDDSQQDKADLHARIDDVLKRVEAALYAAIADKPDRDEIDALLKPLIAFQKKSSKSTTQKDIDNVISQMTELAPRIQSVEEAYVDLESRIPEPSDDNEEEESDEIEEEEKEPVMPIDFEWQGTRLRLRHPDGSWGEWVELRGATGMPMDAPYGTLPSAIQKLVSGSGVTVTPIGNGAYRFDAQGTPGSGSIINATNSGDNKTYNLTGAPTTSSYYALVNNEMYTTDDAQFPFSVVGSQLIFSSALPSDTANTIIKLVCV